jgi:hypothetical protein
MPGREHPVRLATVFDAAVVARLLDDFNREFQTSSQGTQVLAARLPRPVGRG